MRSSRDSCYKSVITSRDISVTHPTSSKLENNANPNSHGMWCTFLLEGQLFKS